MTQLNVQVFADGADIEEMKAAYKINKLTVSQRTSLMAKAGVTDYKAFAEEAVKEIPDASISFEVFADDIETMEKSRNFKTIWGKCFVKIPVVNTKGESMIPLIKNYLQTMLD